MSTFKNIFLDLFFPRVCLSCGKGGSYICNGCFSKINYLSENNKKLIACMDYRKNPAFRKLLINLKYNFVTDVEELVRRILKSFFEMRPNLFSTKQHYFVVPVPLNRRRLKQRGFNQADMVAKYLCERFPHCWFLNCLCRQKYQVKQSKLKKTERVKNLVGAFEINPGYEDLIDGSDIIIVDDVVTTGTTINECRKVLEDLGANSVCAFVLARR